MNPSIIFQNIWFDIDVVELKITVDDGQSRFSSKVYVGYQQIEDLLNELNRFKTQVHGGILNLNLGEFGPEYANGAFGARFHFQSLGKIMISVRIQTDYFDFGMKNVASEALMYLVSEPALLNKFINQFSVISQAIGNSAKLDCIDIPELS